MSNDDVVKRFANGETPATYSQNVYAETSRSGNGILYSYGRHFPLAVRRTSAKGETWYLLNGDKYSVSTSKHQNYTFRHLPDHPRVSFTALKAAGIDPETCKLIDFTPDYQDSWYATSWEYTGSPTKSPNPETFEAWKARQPMGTTISTHLGEDKISIYSATAHRVGTAVLKQDGKYFICSMDESSYFVSQLPKKVKTTAQAFDALKPKAVRQAEADDREIVRQGEWFFIKQTAEELAALKPKLKLANTVLGKNDAGNDVKGFLLAAPRPGSALHIATKGVKIGKKIFATGRVFHKRSGYDYTWGDVLELTGEHRTLKLGADVWQAVENTAVESWSVGGNVD